LLAVVLAVVAIGSYAITQSFASTVYATSQWHSALDRVIHADVAQSVTLPSGRILWVFGDTTQVNGKATVSW
jgi:hypothetical protein